MGAKNEAAGRGTRVRARRRGDAQLINAECFTFAGEPSAKVVYY